jgi:hypothetical protein
MWRQLRLLLQCCGRGMVSSAKRDYNVSSRGLIILKPCSHECKLEGGCSDCFCAIADTTVTGGPVVIALIGRGGIASRFASNSTRRFGRSIAFASL